jgi:peroxiredoxin
VVIAVAVHDSASDARRFVQAHTLSFPTAIDHSEKTVDSYGVQALPELFVISPDGHVVEHFRGLMPATDIERAVVRHM